MEKLPLIILGLATLGACQDPILLWATDEPQNLTTPDLDVITRPKDFRWRIMLNNTEDGDFAISLNINFLNITNSVNCTDSYLEIIPDNYTEGRRCNIMENEYFMAYGSQLDIILHVGSETGTTEFFMTYTVVERIICIFPYYQHKKFRFTILFVVPVLLLIVGIGVCCCLRKRCRKQKVDKAKEANATMKERPAVKAAFTGPPSYEDVTKTDPQPPPYSSLALA